MRYSLAIFSLLVATSAYALDLSSLSNKDATGGLKDALIQAAGSAVGKLGVADGFMGNPKVKIPLPDSLKKVEKGMRMFGMGEQADELVLRMNRAAVEVARLGHIPVIGVNAALPVLDAAGLPYSDPLMMEISLALAARCDACLHIARSPGADREAELIRAKNLPVWTRIEDVPPAE